MDEINTNSELNFVGVKKPSRVRTRVVLLGGLFLILLGTVVVYGYVFTRDNFFSFQTNQSIQAAGRGFVSIDAYTCKNGLSQDHIVNYFVKQFNLKDTEINFIEQGKGYPS